MPAMPKIDLNPHDWDEISRILRIHVPGYEVWAFGSRVTWSAKQYSDLDLAVITKQPLPLSVYADLKNAFEESSLSIKVDVVDWAAITESFRRIVEKDKVVVQMPQPGLVNWTFKRLIDCTRDGNLSYGIVQPGQHDEKGIPIVRVNNINSGQLAIDEVLRVSPEIEVKYKRTRLEGGEVLLTLVGSTGQSVVVPIELAGWNIARAIAVIRPRPEIGANWINICLQTRAVQQFLDERANTTVQKTLNLGDVKEVPIPIPPREVKDAIESVAMVLANKIELNRRMNETLEAIARAMFKSWFVDFDPIRAKMSGEPPESICQRLGLTPDLLALFPDRLVDSELGEIPEGWGVGTLGDVAQHPRRGIQPSKIATATPYIALEHMPRRCIALSDWDVADDLESNKFEFKKGEVLFGKLRPYFHKVGVAPVDGVCSTDIVVIAPKADEWFGFVLGHVSSDAFVEHTNAGSTGTKMPRTSWSDMSRYSLVMPPDLMAAAYSAFLRPLVKRITASIHEARTLAMVRDTLLPKLLSGELRIETEMPCRG